MITFIENYKKKRALKKEIEKYLSLLEAINKTPSISIDFDDYRHFLPEEVCHKMTEIAKQHLREEADRLIKELEILEQ